jgi:hypothetical protein
LLRVCVTDCGGCGELRRGKGLGGSGEVVPFKYDGMFR